jgi:HK97 family phage major capsid protein
MPYNSLTSRTNSQALIPEQVSRQIWKSAYSKSLALRMFPRTPPLANNQMRIPVLSVLPTAYFVTGDTGLKQTTAMAWSNVFLNVEELAVIVPIPQAVLDDTAYDLWAEVKPAIVEAIGLAIDNAVFFGVNKPASWPADISTAAIAAGNTVTAGTNNAAAGGIAGDISDVFGTVEADGYEVNCAVAPVTLKSALRKVRNTLGERLGADIEFSGVNGGYSAEGIPITFGMKGIWPAAGTGAVEYIAGDCDQAVVGVRQDITMTVADQAVLQDNTGAIQYNLFQQDMVAARFVIRLGWAIPNPINRQQPTSGSRYPFAVLRMA